MLQLLRPYLRKPTLFEKSKTKFWDDPYISQSMLKAHLEPDLEGATRKHDFVKQSVDWISNLLPICRYKRIIDLGCGPGIYAELFHAKGYQVTGMDISDNSIQYAQKTAKERGLDISYKKGDYIQCPIGGEYDLATMIYCDMGVLSHAERKALLRKIFDALAPGGCLLFDVFTPYEYEHRTEFKIWNYEEGGFWREKPYLLLHSLYRYDYDNTFLNQYIVITDKDVTSYNNWEHTFVIEELEQELREAGFQSLQFYGDAAGTEYTQNSKTICVAARKDI